MSHEFDFPTEEERRQQEWEEAQLIAAEEAAEEALIDSLIDEIEELDSLIDEDAAELSAELRPLVVAEDVYEDIKENATWLDRLSDKIAESVGSWTFIISFILMMIAWMAFNLYLGEERAIDPFPFILLNLALSTLAGLQAPIILMSQNRQSEKDRLLARNDYEVNLKSELEIADLHRKVDELSQTIATQSRMMNALLSYRREEVRLAIDQAHRKRQEDRMMPIETGMS